MTHKLISCLRLEASISSTQNQISERCPEVIKNDGGYFIDCNLVALRIDFVDFTGKQEINVYNPATVPRSMRVNIDRIITTSPTCVRWSDAGVCLASIIDFIMRPIMTSAGQRRLVANGPLLRANDRECSAIRV